MWTRKLIQFRSRVDITPKQLLDIDIIGCNYFNILVASI